ncbi:hypothetical protein QL285_038749 [Trifolium repens]|nr:hypothetical protein QL285_038749 [Trifolium repens]
MLEEFHKIGALGVKQLRFQHNKSQPQYLNGNCFLDVLQLLQKSFGRLYFNDFLRNPSNLSIRSRTRSSFIVVLITTSSCCAITTLSSLRVGGGFWRRGGETPSAVKWEYRIIEIRKGSWSYVAGSIGRAPVQRRLWPLQHQRNMQRSY